MCSLNTTTAVASSIPLYKLFRAAGINPSFLILLAAVLILFAAGENASAKTEGSDAVRNAAGQNQARGYLGPSVDFNWFWVFYERESAGSHATFIVRPFYLKTGTNTSFFQASLMPILFWRYKTPDYDKWKWLFGFGQVDDVRREGKRDFDFGFFPLLFFGFGTDAVKENYFFLWPIGGMLKDKFVTNKLSAYVFPGFLLFVFFPPAGILSWTTLGWGLLSLIPVYLYYEVGEFKAWNIVWPFLYYGRGGLREDFRIFPIFSIFRKRGWYDKYSVMFIVNYQRFYFSDDLHHTFFLLPLVGRKWSRSGRMSAVTFLWPLFSWGYDKRIGDWRLNVPWPLVQIEDCETPKIYKRIFFPFYGMYRYGNSETMFITPFYFRLRKSSYRFDSEDHFSILIFWFYRRSYHTGPDSYFGNEWRYFKMWPVFNVEYNDLGDRSFNMLSLLLFRDREGYERMYQPFWSVLEYVRLRNGEQRLGLFLRLWFQRWEDTSFFCKIPFMISVGVRENRLTELAFLEYMFGYSVKRKGRYCRIFWIPIRIGDSKLMPPDPAENENNHGGNIACESYLLIDRPLDSFIIMHRFLWGE
jgi:hypothetical protein